MMIYHFTLENNVTESRTFIGQYANEPLIRLQTI